MSIGDDTDDERGLYRKYKIERTDGSSTPGGKHEHCSYFVLDIEHDEFSEPALRAYARACRARFPDLADDIETTLDARPTHGGFGPQSPSEMASDLMQREEEK